MQSPLASLHKEWPPSPPIKCRQARKKSFSPSTTACNAKIRAPLWITVWGGVNTLAQALLHIRETRSPADTEVFVSHLRVYSISDQDDAGP
jgi:hypothetical protein